MSMDDPQQPLKKSTDGDGHTESDSADGASARGKGYGWFSFEPRCLQWFNTALCFIVLMTVTNTFQSGITNGLMGAAQSNIERRFQLTSRQSSWIVVVYEIATIPLDISVMYFGTVGIHRPRWMSIFLFISLSGCFLYALPHFTTPVYDVLSVGSTTDLMSIEQTCGANISTCHVTGNEDSGQSSLQNYIAVFILGRICLAFGGTGLYSFGITFIDDSVTRDKLSLYSSFLALGGVLGPAIGFILGGYLLTLHTDFLTLSQDEISSGVQQDDPRWVGAWWLGYVGASVGLMLTTIPMTGFPYDLPGQLFNKKSISDLQTTGADKMRLKKVNEASGLDEDPTIQRLKVNFGLKQLPRFMKDVFTNWSFLSLVLYLCCDVAIMVGFSTFGPKFIEVMFGLTSANAGMLFGIIVVPAGLIGAVGGGLLIERLKLPYTRIVQTQLLTSILTIFALGSLVIHCEQTLFAGVNSEYPSNGSQSLRFGQGQDHSAANLTSPCNAQCSCHDVTFDPVCFNQSLQFYSPCHAGCSDVSEDIETGLKMFHNCSCLPDSTDDGAVAEGICPKLGCSTHLYLFCALLFAAMVFLFINDAMNISTIIRVVPNSHRLLAMLCEDLIVRLLGTIPGPILYASAFDAACVLWQKTCDNVGSCYHYDLKRLGFYVLLTTVILKATSCVFIVLAWRCYKPPKPMTQEVVAGASGKETAIELLENKPPKTVIERASRENC